jgi:phosphopantetheine--protein transferase-like protein
LIHGIGIDIVRINRIEESVKNFEESFLERIFTRQEIEYCYKRKNPYPSLAARFAAKEAVIKAVHTEESIPLKDIEVMIADSGKPSIRPGKNLQNVLSDEGVKTIHLSLSHEKKYAVAHVVLEA